MSSKKTDHWLKNVAGHAGLALDLPAQPDIAAIREAWPTVVGATGLSDSKFTQKVAAHFRIGVADVSTYDPQAVKLIPEGVARRHGILAMSASEANVVIATSDPTRRSAINDIVAHSSRQPVFLMASPTELSKALERAYAPARAPRNSLQTLVDAVAQSQFQIVTNMGQGLSAVGGGTGFDLEDPNVVKLADLVLQQGVRYRATEIHIEPGADQGRVRYRIDGVLQHVVDLPATAHHRLVARLKFVAFDQPGSSQEDGFTVRLSPEVEKTGHLLTTPTPDGELVWIRLSSPTEVPTLEDLSFSGPEAQKVRQVVSKTESLLLVTGPARSGTTSFVYAALHALQGHSVISLEGRPELVVPGVTQIKYDPSTGLSFAESLQQLLDRSPDVLHAGEIRDLATARIVLRTAVTGRKVIATVHTSDAVSGVRRLVDLGLAPGRLAESLHAVVSLRLVRRLCDKCARPFDPEQDANSREAKLAAAIGLSPVKRAVGCRVCAGTGYLRQIPVPEVLVVNAAMRDALSNGFGEEEFLGVARASGMRTFSEVGLDRVRAGETTVEEIERVVGVVPIREETAQSAGPVLVVDPESQDRQLVRAVLAEMGFDVVEAPEVDEAEELLASGGNDFSLVIMDLNLPGVDGRDLLRSIRRSLATQSLPVVVLTASENPQDELELLEAGADDFLLKPVVADRLEARVRAVLRRSGVRIQGAALAT